MTSLIRPLSLYVHIPFCKAKCTYCDFYSIIGRESSIPAYLRHVIAEIRNRQQTLDLSNHFLDTIFFGGGTPNLLEPRLLEQLLGALLELAPHGKDIEIGMEVNPGEASLEDLRSYRELGVNRVSIGMQSFQPHLLKFMSRIHTVEKSFSTYEDVRTAGFGNVSADLIFAVPGQTRDIWVNDLKKLVSLEPDHISTYSLTVEEDTALHRWVAAGHVHMLEASTDTGMYVWGREYLESVGYPNYEISNHAKPGHHCRHNLNYWTGIDYLGFGPAAHSFFSKRRWWNIRNLDQYMQAISNAHSAEADHETISAFMARNEMILTRLRLSQGLPLDEFRELHGEDLLRSKNEILIKWADHLIISEGHLRLSPLGWALADEISSDLMVSSHRN